MRPALIALFTVLAGAGLASADNWPAFRGPHRDGHSPEKSLPLTWSATENVRWKIGLPGPGNSSPVVWGDRIFLTQSLDKKGHKRALWCLARKDGSKIWQREVEYAGDEPTYEGWFYAQATPVTDGQRIIVSFGSAGLYCYDMDGNEQWRHDLGMLYHIWGNASPPVLYENLVILQCGPGERQFLLALDKATGKPAWKHDEPGVKADGYSGSWSTPVIAKINGRDELIVCVPGKVKAFDPKTGSVRWWCDGMGPLVYTTPAVAADGTIVAFSGYGGPALAVRGGGKGDVTKTHRQWHHVKPKNPQRIGSPVILGDYCYLVSEPGIAQCFEFKTGKDVWGGEKVGRQTWSSLIATADGKLFIPDFAGDTHVLEASPKFNQLRTNSLGGKERVNATIAASDGELFIRSYRHLWCIGKQSPQDDAGAAKSDAAGKSVTGMRLKVSANGRYFVDQASRPFFYLGDTCWLLFQRINHQEVDEYLKDRAGKGFTVIQAYVIRGLDRRHPDGNISLLGEPPFIDRDPTKPNEAYFKNVDYIINRANELGLVMGLVTVKSWHVNKHPEKVFDEKNAYTFGKFLGERYKNNAVLWYPGGDSAPGKDGGVWEAMARGLKDGSGGTQLVSYHGNGQTSSSLWFHKAPWLDFNSIQSGHGWAARTYRFVDKDHALSPAKPTVDMEPPYENHPTGAKTPRIDAHQVRQAAYWNMLAGAAGHGYGALDLFWLYKDSDGPFPRNGFQPWRKAMAYEGARQMGLMRRLFELRPWYKLVPDQSVIAAGEGEGEDLVRAARAEDGSFVIAYLPTGKPISIKMDRVAAKTVKAQWYDPRQGSWQKIGAYPGTGTREFTAPSRGARDDWVLVLEDADKDLPTAR
jgi:outer membrane protein assembly factor BamB